jgi:hypothetical protein
MPNTPDLVKMMMSQAATTWHDDSGCYLGKLLPLAVGEELCRGHLSWHAKDTGHGHYLVEPLPPRGMTNVTVIPANRYTPLRGFKSGGRNR